MDDTLIIIFFVDKFCKEFMSEWEKYLMNHSLKKYRTSSRLSISEIMTILIYFHQCRFRDFKTYYNHYYAGVKILEELGMVYATLKGSNCAFLSGHLTFIIKLLRFRTALKLFVWTLTSWFTSSCGFISGQ
jgi:hypothetical protein